MSAVAETLRLDPEIELLVPERDVPDPVLSIVIPALDEALTIQDFVAWCHEGLREAGVPGEILIIDSSTDATPQLALAAGARVLRTPRRGLGRAYMDAIPYIRGEWIVMGDADCTYDFRSLRPFVERFQAGDEYVMGSRWKGSIQPGAMPRLHQYFGTPVTTWILNRLYSSEFSDIHCGMRGITKDALIRMDLQSQSWEYASEMVLKSVHMHARTSEVPVRFLKDRDGRVSHHKRMGWFSPWQAAWINLRAMFVHGSEFFVFKPGLVLLALGLLLTLPLAGGPIEIGPVTLSLYVAMLGLVLTTIGLTSVLLGAVAQVLFDYTGEARRRWSRLLPYTRTVLVAGGLCCVGVVMVVPLVHLWLTNDFKLDDPSAPINHLAVVGLTAMLSGFMLFACTLLLHGAMLATRTRDRP
ncbi:MAG TPA: glycosyltransferase family 2 protein [Baekduia sp.]|uniref:glycosyltransferase family 2 protein n=1 Tax=Baekduia sp. TaxID=2600305 RepID=UPI002D79B29E|nr:glycosyltransferase family 2 protein [Baekduia sp.]HET6509510.1 glycosyltransferase family 2 protein [Baekduia sp.]